MPRIERVQLVRRSLAEVFDFFSDAYNLEAITPAYLKFGILTPAPIEMKAGALIDYRLQLFGVPLVWKTRIENFEPMTRFVDRQIHGPYALWHHLHEFYETSEGTLVVDQVDYRIGWSIFGGLAHAAFVRRTLDDIFDYRRQRVSELLDTPLSAAVAVSA